jgi:sec-independent protein translocase protein TatA
MPNIGPMEIVGLFVIVFLLFGATRLPKLGKSMGQSIRGFKTGLQEDAPDDDEKPATGEAAKLELGDVTDKS